VPIIYDPAADTYISDSLAITLHLERTYPDTPALFPPGSHAATALFQDAWNEKAVRPLIPLMLERVHARLTPRSQAYFRCTREAIFKCTLEGVAPVAKRPEMWAAVRVGLGVFDKYMEANGDGPFFAGGHVDRMSTGDTSGQPTYMTTTLFTLKIWKGTNCLFCSSIPILFQSLS
jgi:glutathione S-transferase